MPSTPISALTLPDHPADADRTATAELPRPRRRPARRRAAAGLLVALAAGTLAAGCSSPAPVTSTVAERPSTVDGPVATGPVIGREAPTDVTEATEPTDVEAPAEVPTPGVDDTRNVQVAGAGVTVRTTPEDGAPVLTELAATTELGSKTTLLVVDEQDGWYQVALPIRPNGVTGWVEAGDVKVRSNDVRVRIDLSSRSLVVTRDGQVALHSSVAIGADDTPTPTGDYFITDLLENEDPNAGYGPFALGLSGHSETLTEFAGGDGQIGIHGTSDPSSIGRNVSHGCVRLPNDVIADLAKALPLGTPVSII